MRTFRLAGLVALLLVSTVPASAQAAPEDGMGCPQGFVAFDAQKGGGGPPSYLPGGEAVASGYLTDATTKAAPSVSLRWGSPGGEVVGQAALDAEGNFQGLRFAIPMEMPHGVHKLFLEAYGADGQMLPGLPIPTQIRVGPPPAAADLAKRTEDAPAAVQRGAARDRVPSAEPLQAPRAARATPTPAVAPRAPAPSAVAPRAERGPQAARPAAEAPAAELRPGGPRPRSELPLAGPASVPAAGVAREDGVAQPLGPWTLILLLGLAGLGVLAARRRRPTRAPVAAPVPRDHDPVEAELQQILAAAEPEAVEPVRVPAGVGGP